ncbi:HNH endonuclease [Streptomyces sp. NPDC102467]|uniref:HNH endonuclease n=1 Tax=Streptomyces sp. NPDC102467 TaxID=3366179 RepID=UPI0037F7E451
MSRERMPEEIRAFLDCSIKARDGKRCFYCARNFKKRPMRRKTVDHYIPWCLWPGYEVANLVLACERCNFSKADRLPWPLVWLLLAEYRQDRWELTA